MELFLIFKRFGLLCIQHGYSPTDIDCISIGNIRFNDFALRLHKDKLIGIYLSSYIP